MYGELRHRVRAKIDEWKICKDRILSASSYDGLRWRRDSGVRIDVRQPTQFDDEMVYGCYVGKRGPRAYEMFYQSSKYTPKGWHSRLLRAVSKDSLSWTHPREIGISRGVHPLCITRVQSPYLLSLPEGKIALYFSGSDVEGTTRILLARYDDDGRNWRVSDSPALCPSAFRGHVNHEVVALADPSIVVLSSGGYRMYATAVLAKPDMQVIVSAFSIDGQSWQPENGVRIAAGPPGRKQTANNPSVLAKPDCFLMWFRGSDLMPLNSSIYLAESHNGLDWNVRGCALRYRRFHAYEGHGVGFPFVFEQGDRYRMFYTGYWGNLLCGHAVSYYEKLHAESQRPSAR